MPVLTVGNLLNEDEVSMCPFCNQTCFYEIEYNSDSSTFLTNTACFRAGCRCRDGFIVSKIATNNFDSLSSEWRVFQMMGLLSLYVQSAKFWIRERRLEAKDGELEDSKDDPLEKFVTLEDLKILGTREAVLNYFKMNFTVGTKVIDVIRKLEAVKITVGWIDWLCVVFKLTYEAKEWYGNGQFKSSYNYKNGLKHGLCRWWYENGQLWSSYNYKDGKEHGLCQSWNSDEQLQSSFNYKDGELIEDPSDDPLHKFITLQDLENLGACGAVLNYFKTNFLNGAQIIDVIKGLEDVKTTTDWIDWLCDTFKLTYEARRWYENGQLRSSYNYKDGKRHGLFQRWSSDGRFRFSCNYSDGPLEKFITLKDLERLGACKEVLEYFKTNFLNGAQIIDVIKGLEDIKTTTCWIDWLCEAFKLTYKARCWHKNGQLRSSYNYKDGQWYGLCKEWHENGQLRNSYTYDDGGLIVKG